MKCFKLFNVSYYILLFQIVLCDEFKIVRDRPKLSGYFDGELSWLYGHQISHLYCISDSINDAIVWNTNLKWKTSQCAYGDRQNLQKVSRLADDGQSVDDKKQCDIIWDECEWSIDYEGSSWLTLHSSDFPMAPVFDRLWETFDEYNTFESNSTIYRAATTNKFGTKANLTFNENGTFVVSVRGGANAHFLMCSDPDYSSSCYWIIIGGWHNAESAIRKCENGVPTVPPTEEKCRRKRASFEHRPLSWIEWKTFIITWNLQNRRIIVYDLVKTILDYTDHEVGYLNPKYLFFGNSEQHLYPMQFRFHQYHYKFTSQLKSRLIIRKVNINSDGELCLDMIISLCDQCYLQVFLYDNQRNTHTSHKISPVAFEINEHGLPMWQHERFSVKNLNETHVPLELQIVTYSDREQLNFFAVREIKQCPPKGTVKILQMTASQDYESGALHWPTVSCQRLSYNKSHAEYIQLKDTKILIPSNPPDNLPLCPENRFGPHCVMQCDTTDSSWSCGGRMICSRFDGCYCRQGYESNNCEIPCSNGTFGYGCKETCDNCLDRNCSFTTGICKAGCGKDNALGKYVPPNCKDMVKFPKLQYDQINNTTLRIYFKKFDQNKMLDVTYEFEIQINRDIRSKQPAEIDVENGTEIYFTIFYNLKEGMKYKARVSEDVKYNSSDKAEVIHLDGDFSEESEMCIWTENFDIDREDKNLTIKKFDVESSYRCTDDWYLLEIFPKYSNSKDTLIEVTGSFPRIIAGLTEDTEYVILISGSTSSFQIRREVSTLPKKPLPVKYFRIVDVRTTEVSARWSPPADPNAKIDFYSLTVKPISFQGCPKSSPKNSMRPQTYSIGNTSNELQLENLIPYVNYEVTISVFYKRPGIEKEDYFRTNWTEIPTAIYENLTFYDDVIKWSNPVNNCPTISGPIRATRLFFHGASEDVKTFTDQYDTESDSLNLDEMDRHSFYGAEKYLVRVHALRNKKGKHNESAYAELEFTTNPRPPPKVTNLTVIEVDTTKQIMFLKWKPPLPPTNGEIIQYKVTDSGIPITQKLVFANATCSLWDGWICATINQFSPMSGNIKVSGKNKNTSNYGDPVTIPDTFIETAPDPPGRVSVSTSEPGTIKLHWGHPFRTGGPMKEFTIHRKLQSTRLARKLSAIDRDESITFSINNYQRTYTTQLNVLPSTHYKIDIHGIVVTTNDKLLGNSSSTEVKTKSLFEWLKTKPSYIVDNSTHSIELLIPDIANYTINTEIHIIIIGETLCPEIPILNDDVVDNIQLHDGEFAWHFGMFTRAPQLILIGDNASDEKDMKCQLRAGNSYVIVVIVREDDGVVESERANPLIWRSGSIQIGPRPRTRHELWAVPLLLLLIIIGGIFYYVSKKRKRIGNSHSKIIVTPPESIAALKAVERIWERSQVKSPSPLPMKTRPETVEYRESIILTPAISLEKLKPTPIVEERYEKIKYTSLVKLNEFQDYVKRAIASGKLNEQYSLFPRGQMKSWDYGELPENKKKNRYGNLIAYDDTRVKLEKLADDPHSDYINANYIKGFKKNRAYIATQGPKPTTIIDFWRMIWQEKVQVICMLANIMEGGKTKCEQYWPEIGKVIRYGNISVSNISHVQFADYTFRIFHIKTDQEIRKIDHLHYTAWPDHGIPLYTQSVVAYLKKLLATPSGNGPILVHCSAGVGRTGTIILCDICLRRAAAEGVVDVFGETDEMRKQRANMVDNKQQYILAHVALVECLLSFPTAIPCNDLLPTRIQEYKKQLPLQQQRLEQSAWQDEALQSSTRLQLELTDKNIAKNRFPESLPFTRLFIPRYPITDDDSSYIHGVYVDSARHQNSFIATQLPLPGTVPDFWRMVAEFKVRLIIILQSPDTEDPTCCKFVPGPDEDISPLTSLNLKGKSIADGEYAIQQKICLIDNLTKTPREQAITILTCKEWDPGRHKPPPKPETLVNLWQVAEKISRNEEPTVVMCHDGVTGCGLYLAMSFLLERMGLEHECDVCFAVRAIRRSRSDLCSTREQFEYLYDAALIYNGFFETYANFT